jgi:UDP-N-acetylmuramyl pentapeptide phosphotransferase/UDP-N-acetylglucosamine-1-phosphate transferase
VVPGPVHLTALAAILGFGLVAAISAICVRVLERELWAASVLDRPTERGLHSRPTPRGGGLAIVGCTLAGSIFGAMLLHPVGLPRLALCVVGGIMVAVVSWRDDVRPVSRLVRLVVHVVAAVLAALGVEPVASLHLPGAALADLGWLRFPIVVLWIVGLTNAFNFMDGIDGLAGGQALVAGLGWAALGCLGGGPFVALVGLVLAAYSLGFLSRNWPPATIFMGDVGSAFIGYVLAVLPVLACPLSPRLLLAGAVLVWPFLFDVGFTLIRRMWHREDILAPHRSHLYQRLVVAGWNHRSVSLLYLALAVLGVVCAVFWSRDGLLGPVLVVPGLPLAAIGLWLLVIWRERAARMHRSRSVVGR